jgi:hypothetical protein
MGKKLSMTLPCMRKKVQKDGLNDFAHKVVPGLCKLLEIQSPSKDRTDVLTEPGSPEVLASKSGVMTTTLHTAEILVRMPTCLWER